MRMGKDKQDATRINHPIAPILHRIAPTGPEYGLQWLTRPSRSGRERFHEDCELERRRRPEHVLRIFFGAGSDRMDRSPGEARKANVDLASRAFHSAAGMKNAVKRCEVAGADGCAACCSSREPSRSEALSSPDSHTPRAPKIWMAYQLSSSIPCGRRQCLHAAAGA
jgi:hypothetical protein